ncbi:MAG: YdiU family protein [Alteromonadaceae bacterium]|nr:YdiU family protein [Alteromonadaceae bacterium]
MKFSNTYIQLSDAFYQRILPSIVPEPNLLLWNDSLAECLQIDQSISQDPLLLAQYFSGNKLPEGAESIALAYAGHQFGGFSPQLGDGRAHLIGEIIDIEGIRQDIQLKGSGPTRFSRRGDGKCAIGPAIREYIMSEAMHALGVPTSRCLAVVATGEDVYRDRALPGAVVTRVAASHIRVGTFQYFAAKGDLASLQMLTDYTISRHFPEIDNVPKNKTVENNQPRNNTSTSINHESKHRIVDFIEHVINKQSELIIQWMRVGFIHGVMNTDNTAISGETIDFGPCAMMGTYHPGTVYSSIDTQGRYAFANQPNIVQWNMARFAECLLPLIDENVDKALEKVEPLISQFSNNFEHAYFSMFSKKIGIAVEFAEDKATDEVKDDVKDPIKDKVKDIIKDLLNIMQTKELDYTETFALLTQSLDDETSAESLKAKLCDKNADWYNAWLSCLKSHKVDYKSARKVMEKNNPVVIPRNHHVEAILKECEDTGKMDNVEKFMHVLRSPYTMLPETKDFQDLPEDGDRYYHTFCGT